MTLGIFNVAQRNKPSSWRLLGYLNDPTTEGIGDPNYKRKDQISKKNNYHHNLSYILEGIHQLEQNDGILWNITSKDKKSLSTIRFKPVLMLVMGDAVGLDKVCDMYQSYNSKTTKYICRDCDCPSDSLNDYKHKCNITLRSELLNMSEEEMKERCFYKTLNNAFDRHDFGGDYSGINGCSPPELLHQFLEGIVKKMMTYIFNSLSVPGMELINDLAKYISTRWHRQSNRQYPNIFLFKDGINKKMLTADEVSYQLFMLYLVLQQTYIMNELPLLESNAQFRTKVVKKPCDDNDLLNNAISTNMKKSLKSGKKNQKSTDNIEEGANEKKRKFLEETKQFYQKFAPSKEKVKKWIQLIEYTLTMQQWLFSKEIPFTDIHNVTSSDIAFSSSSQTNPNHNELPPAEKSIRTYLKVYEKMVAKIDGCGTQVAKVHWMLHYTRYCRKYGAFINYDGSIGERHLKQKVKNPARRTQKRQTLLASQAAQRDYEKTTIDMAYQILELNGTIPNQSQTNDSDFFHNANSKKIDSADRSYIIKGKFQINFDRNFEEVKSKSGIDKSLLKGILKRLKMSDFQLKSSHLSCFSILSFIVDHDLIEYDEEKIVSFRSNPLFHGKPWLDWCLTSWVEDSSNSSSSNESGSNVTSFTTLLPTQILLFINPNEMKFGVEDVENTKGSLWAVVRTTVEDSTRRNKTRQNFILSESYEIEKQIRIIDCDYIQDDTFVVADVEDTYYKHSENSVNGLSKLYTTNHVICLNDITKWSRKFVNCDWKEKFKL